MTNLEAALAYAKRGWRIHPLHSVYEDGRCTCRADPCTQGLGKHPRLAEWPKQATTGQEQIQRWWRQWPDANIGVVTGSTSGICVLDIDPRNEGDREALLQAHGPLPETPQVLSGGGGTHDYFLCPDYLPSPKIGHGVDFLADGNHYVLAPPSRHASGKLYEWELSLDIDDVSIKPLPRWLESFVKQHANTAEVAAQEMPEALPKLDVSSLKVSGRIKDIIREGEQKGKRSERLFAAIAAMHRAGYGHIDIAAVMLDPENGISEKAWEQKNARSPSYHAQVKGWMAKEIARVISKMPEEGGRRQRNSIPKMYEANHQQNGAINALDNDIEGDLPLIEISQDITLIIDEAESAITRMEPPAVFQRSRGLSMITRQGPRPKWITRDQDAPTIADVSQEYLWELCSQTANWEKFDRRSAAMVRVLPPKWVPQTMLKRPGWKFPFLAGIITSPTLRPDGSVIEKAGYDQDTGLYLNVNGTRFPQVPTSPTFDEARAAYHRIQALFEQFDYEDESHKVSVLAAILTILCRHLIDGSVPMWVFSGTKPGSGKTLLARCISLIATGRNPATYSQTSDDEEERKRLFTIAIHGDPIALIDNITEPLGSPALNMVLTTEEISDRILGANKQATIAWNAVLMGTGNNVLLKGDMFRRVMSVKLDPKVANPEARDDFDIRNLDGHVKNNRAQLAIDGLTIIKAYMDAGKPKQAGLDEIGGFENWNRLIRHALVWLGCTDPAAARCAAEDGNDPMRAALSRLLESWYTCYRDEPQILRTVMGDIHEREARHGPGNEWNDLYEALTEFDSTYDGRHLNMKKLGWSLRRHHGFMVGKLRFQKAGGDTVKNAQHWQVVEVYPG